MKRITSISEMNMEYIKDGALPILEQALDNIRCTVYIDRDDGCFNIIVSVPKIAEQGNNKHNFYGLYLAVHGKEFSGNVVHAWLAEEQNGDIDDSYAAGDYPFTMSLDEIITAATNELNKCDYCKKNVGLANLTLIGFANKSCPDCESKAWEAMGPGWDM